MHMTSLSDASIFPFPNLLYFEPTSRTKLGNPGSAGFFQEFESPQDSYIVFEPDFSSAQLDFEKYRINKETHSPI